MSDLRKYIIGTIAGILVCLLCVGGYYFFTGTADNDALALNRHDGNASGLESGTEVHDPFAEDGSGLTPEQQARLSAAYQANQSLEQQKNGNNSDFGHSADKSGLTANGNEQRQKVRRLIVKGKNAARKKAVNDAFESFDAASDAMPDEKPFASDSYYEMADSSFHLSKNIYDESHINTSLNKAESYIKKSLAAENTEKGRALYAEIVKAQKEIENYAAQQKLRAQQEKRQESRESARNQRKEKVRDAIARGKKSAREKQTDSALFHFNTADNAMPDEKAFAVDAYTDMAQEMFRLSQNLYDEQDKQKALDKAEEYAKKALAAQNTPDTRNLYADIIEAQKRVEKEKKRAEERRYQAQLRAQEEARARRAAAAQKKQQQETVRKQVKRLIADGTAAARKKQISGAMRPFDQADRIMPNDDSSFAADSYGDMANELFDVSRFAPNETVKRNTLDKAEEYSRKALAAKDTPSGRKLSSAIAAAKQYAEKQRKLAETRKAQEREKARQQAALKQKQEAEKRKRNEQIRADVKAHIAQGKKSARRKQISGAASSFDKADRIMPDDDTHFAADSYYEMADTMLPLARTTRNEKDVSFALDKAEQYIKKSLAAENTPQSRALEAKIAAERKKAAVAKAQAEKQKQAFAKRQEALRKKREAQKKAQQERAAAARAQAEKRKEALAKRREALRKKREAEKKERAAAAAAKAKADKIARQEAAQRKKAAVANAAKNTQKNKTAVLQLVSKGKKAAAGGNYPAARQSFDKASMVMPTNDNPFTGEQYREMADSMYGLSKKVPAQKRAALKSGSEYIKKSVAANNRDAEAHFVYAGIADDSGNAALALKELETAQRLAPDNYLYNYELGKKYFQLKRYKEAKACFEQAVKANEKAAAAWVDLGLTHKIMRADAAAVKAFSGALKNKPDYVRAWLEIARVQAQRKKSYAASLKTYKKVLSLDSSNTAALQEMGQVYAKLNDTSQAEQYFKKAMSLGDNDPVTRYNLAVVQLDSGKFGEALQYARQAVNSNKNDARFLYTYALALEKNKRTADAETYYKKTLAADKTYSKAKINLGRICLEKGNLDTAEKYLRSAYASEPKNFEVNTNLGKLYGIKKDYNQSIKFYADAIAILPDDIEAQENLAAAYISSGQKEKACDTYKHVLTLDPKAWDCYYELGKVYISLGSKAEAKTVLNKLLAQKPQYRHAGAIKKMLTSL